MNEGVNGGGRLRAAWLLLCVGGGLGGCQSSSSVDCSKPENKPWCEGETGQVCEGTVSEVGDGEAMQIRVRNDRSVPVYIPSSHDVCTWEPLALLWEGARVYWSAGAWVPTCDQLLSQSCSWGCSDGPSSVVRLEPGASYAFTWEGYVYAEVEIDAACAAENDCAAPTSCHAGRQLESGSALQAQVRVSESCDLETCECGSEACVIQTSSLVVEGLASETLSFDIVYDGTEQLLAIGE